MTYSHVFSGTFQHLYTYFHNYVVAHLKNINFVLNCLLGAVIILIHTTYKYFSRQYKIVDPLDCTLIK